MCPSSSHSPSLSHPNPVLPQTLPNPHLTHKYSQTHIFKNETPPKQFSTINIPIDPSNHPQLIFNYPSSASLYLFKPKIPSLLSHNLLSILPLLETTFESYSGMLMGFAPVILNLYNFSLKISTISFSCKSRTSPLTPPSTYPTTRLFKKIIL